MTVVQFQLILSYKYFDEWISSKSRARRVPMSVGLPVFSERKCPGCCASERHGVERLFV